MSRVIRGRFECTDDFDLQFNHILNWNSLADLPQDGATTGQAMAWDGSKWTPATLSASGVVLVTWGDIEDKPSTFPPETHTHTWSEVTGKPTFVNSVTAGSGINVSGTTGTVAISDSYHTHTNEPTGFLNTTDSSISITNNRTFSIEPTGTSFQYYDQGVLKTVSSTESITFSDTEGLKIFYYDGGVLSVTTVFDSDTLIGQTALVAISYWDATNNQTLGLGDERHGITMDGATHRWMHLERGTIYVGGHALGDIVTDGDGSASTHASMSVASGTIADEDLYLSAVGKSNPANIPVFYLSGTGTKWRKDTARDWPVKNFSGGSGYLAYNYYDGASWVQAEVSANRYVLAHIIRTNGTSSENQYIAIQGQETYTGIANAQDGAAEELNNLVTTGLPVAEFHPLGSVIFQTGAYANTPKARIRPTAAGDDYVDWRFQSLSPASPPGDHGNLAGLADPDHPLTALQQSSAVTGQVAEWSGSAWVPATVVNDVTASTNITISATQGTNVSIAVVDAPTFAGTVTCTDLKANQKVYVDNDGTATYSQIVFNSGNATLSFYSFYLGPEWQFLGTAQSANFDDCASIYSSYWYVGQYYLSLNMGGADADQFIYFREGGSNTGRYFKWDNGDNRFEMNDELYLSGKLTSTGATITGNVSVTGDVDIDGTLTVDTDGGNQPVCISLNGATNDGVQIWCETETAVISHVDPVGSGFGDSNMRFSLDNVVGDNKFIFYGAGTTRATIDLNGTIWFYGPAQFGGTSISIKYGGPDTQQSIYFHEGGSDTGRYIRWHNTNNEFQINDSVTVTGTLTASASVIAGADVIADGDVHVNADAGGSNSNIIFNSGSATLSYYSFYLGPEWQFLSSSAQAANFDDCGTIYSSHWQVGTWAIYLNKGGSDADQFIYFREGGSNSGRYFKWDNGDNRFEMNDELYLTGKLTATGATITGNVSITGDLDVGSGAVTINSTSANTALIIESSDSTVQMEFVDPDDTGVISWDGSAGSFTMACDLRVTDFVNAVSGFKVDGSALDIAHIGGSGASSGDVPTWNATATEWQPVAGGASGSSNVYTASKTAKEEINSDATLTDDSDLQIEVDAGAQYSIEALIRWDAHTAADFKFSFSGPTGATVLYGYDLDDGAGTVYTSAQSVVLQGAGYGSTRFLKISGLAFTSATTAGTVAFQWAQGTSYGGTTTVYRGSWLKMAKADNI